MAVAAGSAIAGSLIACTASAQITVPITGVQLGNAAPASPDAAYSNITDYLGTTNGGSSLGLSFTVFSNVTAVPALQGQAVQHVSLGVTLRPELTDPAPTRRCRVQFGFWNADGPNGTAGTPVQGLAGLAQYQTSVLEMTRGTQVVITMALGSSGFLVPAGGFFFGVAYDTRGLAGSSASDFSYSLFGTPTVGTNQPSLYTGAYPTPPFSLFGIPWGVTFGTPSGPTLNALTPGPDSLGIELMVPGPSSAAAVGAGWVLALRRRRS